VRSPESTFISNGGVPTVTVVAHDLLRRLTHGDRSFAFSFLAQEVLPPDAVIAELVGFTNLLVPLVDLTGAALF
jgi:hypothetical protein